MVKLLKMHTRFASFEQARFPERMLNCSAEYILFINSKELFESKKGGKDQELMIQSSTTPDPHKQTSQTRAKRSVFSQQVTTRHQ